VLQAWWCLTLRWARGSLHGMTGYKTSVWLSDNDHAEMAALGSPPLIEVVREGLKAMGSPRAVKAREARQAAEAEAQARALALRRKEQAAKAAKAQAAERALEGARAALHGRRRDHIPPAEKIRVAAELAAAGVSQQKIGDLFGVSKQGVAYWLRSVPRPADEVPHVVPFRAAAVKP
jgi:hypothetical protein